MKIQKAVSIFAALAHESRLAIFKLLLEESNKGLAAGIIADMLHIPPATLSFHIAQLSKAGLVSPHREGRTVIYTINLEKIKKIRKFLKVKDVMMEKVEKAEKEKVEELVVN